MPAPAKTTPALPVRVIEFSADNGLEATVEGPDIQWVTGADAKRLAIKMAAQYGYARCGINGSTGPWIVDGEGNGATSEDANERWAEEAEIARSGSYAYRNTFKLMQGVGA